VWPTSWPGANVIIWLWRIEIASRGDVHLEIILRRSLTLSLRLGVITQFRKQVEAIRAKLVGQGEATSTVPTPGTWELLFFTFSRTLLPCNVAFSPGEKRNRFLVTDCSILPARAEVGLARVWPAGWSK